MKKIFLRSLSIVIVVLFPAVLHAFNADLTTWKSVYPNSTLGNTLSCNLCHGSSSKTKANATVYGNAVWGASPISAGAIRAAEGLDSDGDGATNIAEINANTDPSNSGSKPATPPPADAAPIARIAVAKTIFTVGETAAFSGSTSSDDKGITKYEWDLNGDNAIDVSGVAASTTYAAAGSYRVTLRVTDTINQTGSASVSITVNAPAPTPIPTPTPTPTPDTVPTARITASRNPVNVGEVVNLSGSGSRDDKGITKYEWDFTSNGSIDATGVNASTSYNTAGTYRIILKVTDTIGQTGTATLNITVSAIGTTPSPSPAPAPPDRGDDRKKKEEEERKKKEDERKKKDDEDRKKREDEERKRRR